MTNTKKSILALSLVAVMIVSVFCLVACNTSVPETDNSAAITEDNSPIDNTDMADSNGIVFHNTELMSLSYASAAAESGGITLTATIGPATASDKNVDWTVAFADASSSWASGKNATDYVTVTPTSDGATTATVTATKGFGEQVVITVASRVNAEAKATCTVDYGARLVDTGTIKFDTSTFVSSSALSSSGIQTVEAPKGGNWQGMFAAYAGNKFKYSAEYKSDYTKATTVSNFTVSVKATDEFYAALQANNIAKSSNSWVTITEYCPKDIYEAMSSKLLIPIDGTDYSVIANVNTFNTAIVAAKGMYDFDIKISVTTDFETKDYIFQCKFNRAGAAFSATSVSLSASNIVL